MTTSEFLSEWNNGSSTVNVHTSGSTGKPKQMTVEKVRMTASARMTCDFLNLHEGDTALLCMPVDYIAGKMMIVRSIERHMKLIEVTPSNHPLGSNTNCHIDFTAMVPSQIYETLKVPAERERLARIRHVIIGGGAVSKEMQQELRSFPNAIWSSYGMTETLSHIALRRLSGNEATDWYTPMHGISLSLLNTESYGTNARTNSAAIKKDNDFKEITNIGQLIISAPHLCVGTLTTNDIAELTADHRFRIIGRTDNVICSGGIKLHIEEIEEALRPYIHLRYCITKQTDAKFGEIVVLLIEADNKSPITTTLNTQEIFHAALPRYSYPKKIIHISRIPITPNGKIDRAAALQIAKEEQHTTTESENNG